MTDHSWRELATPYALGALDRGERLEFEAHLAECAMCRGEVQSFRDLSELLAHAAPAAVPAPGLRDRILRDARRVRPFTGRRPVLPWVVAAASVVLALVAGNAYRRERAARGEATRALADTRDGLAARDSLIATLLSPDVGTAGLAATGQPPSARLFWIPSRHRVVMAVYRLPPAPAGRTYQLWAIAKGKPVSLGIFNTAPDGSLRTVMDVPPNLAFQVTAVTEEPAGGSPQPTQQPFLIGKLVGGD
jgi:anti-sigma-K factor RskA